MDDYGNDTNSAAQWKAIDQLRERQTLTEQALAVIKHEQTLQRKQNQALIEGNARIEALLNQGVGGLRLGRWIALTAAGFSGAIVAVWIWLKNGSGGG